MEIVRLGAEDYREFIDLLDAVFSRKNNREQHFEEELPKMCVPDDLHMNRHLGIREDGRLCAVLGIYPLPTLVGGIPLLFSTVGNVATHWEYEGRGYMRLLMQEAMKELDAIGADASRLGGQRQRYNRYGYESCGNVFSFTLTDKNIKSCMPGFSGDLHFVPIKKEDKEALAFTWELYQQNQIVVDRMGMPDYQDVYASLVAWRCEPWLALDADDIPVGYLTANPNGSIAEWGARSTDIAFDMICAWQQRLKSDISFRVAPYQTLVAQRFSRICESVAQFSPSHFQIRNWDKVVDAFMKLRTSMTLQPDGVWNLEIKDYGTIRMWVKDGLAGCERTAEEPEMVLDRFDASRLLFGPLPTFGVTKVPPFVQAWLPLPLSWNGQDRV